MSKVRNQTPSRPSADQLPRIQAVGKIKREIERRRYSKGYKSGFACLYGASGLTSWAVADRFVKIFGYDIKG